MLDPFFSIVIVSLNAENVIGKTIESIQKQTFTDYEVIVKDGGSNDNTLSFVPIYDERFFVYQISDKSLYDAMNQAIKRTNGKYIIFMNCGDAFASSDVLEKTKKAINKRKYSLLYGDYCRDEIIHKQPRRLNSFELYRTPLCHQSVFFNGDLLRNGEIYNTKYRILADYDLELRIIKKGEIGHFPVVVCDYQGGGLSETKNGIKRKRLERKMIVKKSFSKWQRIICGMKYHASMPKLRTLIIYSDKTPKTLKKLYQSMVNRINGRK